MVVFRQINQMLFERLTENLVVRQNYRLISQMKPPENGNQSAVEQESARDNFQPFFQTKDKSVHG